jgi:hypothetical protein
MFDCEVKFLLDTKLIDSKNYDNFEVFCFCFCGYEIIYYYLFENEQCLCLKYELKSSLFLVVIMSKMLRRGKGWSVLCDEAKRC